MTTQYFVRKACLERDRQEILSVWDRNKVNTHDPALHLDWAYKNNPAGQGPIFLLVHAPSQETVGSAGLILRRMKIGDSVRLVGRAAGFAVDKAHRSLGPAILLQKAVLDNMGQSNISLAYTLAPSKASPVFKRLDFSNLGIIKCRRKIISASSFVDNRFQFLPRVARKSLSSLIELCIQMVSKETWNQMNTAKMIRVQSLDNRFDDLWSRAASNYSFTTERSSTFLQWRFSNNPKQRDFVCDALCTDKGTLRGYAIYYLDKDRFAHVIDLFAEDQGVTTIKLLQALAHRWRADGVASVLISAFGSERFFDILDNVRLSKQRAPAPQVPYELFVSKISNLDSRTTPIELNWGFTMADDFQDYL
jgi:hypothetical protein